MSQQRDVKINVFVDNEKHTFSIQEELTIDRDDLDTELARQAAHYAWFAVLRERARAERLALEGEVDQVWSRIDQEIRQKSEKKPTEDAIKNAVKTDPRYIEASNHYQKSERDERLLGAIEMALVQRKDMLIALSRSRVNEMHMPSADEVEKIKNNLLRR